MFTAFTDVNPAWLSVDLIDSGVKTGKTVNRGFPVGQIGEGIDKPG